MSLNSSQHHCKPFTTLHTHKKNLNYLFVQFSGPYRTCSPGLILREYKSSQSPIDITRIYTYSYLTAEPSQGYLKRPLDPYDRPPPKSPHFHRPPSKFPFRTYAVLCFLLFEKKLDYLSNRTPNKKHLHHKTKTK